LKQPDGTQALSADSVVDTLVEGTPWRVDGEVLFILFEVLDVVIGQSRDLVDVTDLFIRPVGGNLAGRSGEHSREVLVITNKSTVEIPLSIRSLLLRLESIIIELLAERMSNLGKENANGQDTNGVSSGNHFELERSRRMGRTLKRRKGRHHTNERQQKEKRMHSLKLEALV
jgi:hypothetical protein